MAAREERSTWGGIARALEAVADIQRDVDDNRMEVDDHERMYPGHRAAAKEADAAGLLGILSGKRGEFIESNKDRMRDLGINPSYRDRKGALTGRYSSENWKDLQAAEQQKDQAVVRAYDYGEPVVGERLSDPLDDAAAKRQLAREYGDLYQQKYSDFPQTGLGITSTRVGRRGFDNPWDRKLGRKNRDLSGLSRDSRFAPGTVPGNVNDTRAYLPGRMSVGEARRARAMRNMSRQDRASAGFGDLGSRSRWLGQGTYRGSGDPGGNLGYTEGAYKDLNRGYESMLDEYNKMGQRVERSRFPYRYNMMGSSQGPETWELLLESLKNAGFQRDPIIERGRDW